MHDIPSDMANTFELISKYTMPLLIAIPIVLPVSDTSIMMIFVVKMFKNRKNKKYYILNVTHNDRTITVSALFDSGNLLKEPITGKCVSILEWEAAKELFDTEIEFSDIENYIEDMKLWAVPFNSLGNSSDVLFAFLADEINIPEENKTIDKTFIGLYGSRLSNNVALTLISPFASFFISASSSSFFNGGGNVSLPPI